MRFGTELAAHAGTSDSGCGCGGLCRSRSRREHRGVDYRLRLHRSSKLMWERELAAARDWPKPAIRLEEASRDRHSKIGSPPSKSLDGFILARKHCLSRAWATIIETIGRLASAPTRLAQCDLHSIVGGRIQSCGSSNASSNWRFRGVRFLVGWVDPREVATSS